MPSGAGSCRSNSGSGSILEAAPTARSFGDAMAPSFDPHEHYMRYVREYCWRTSRHSQQRGVDTVANAIRRKCAVAFGIIVPRDDPRSEAAGGISATWSRKNEH